MTAAPRPRRIEFVRGEQRYEAMLTGHDVRIEGPEGLLVRLGQRIPGHDVLVTVLEEIEDLREDAGFALHDTEAIRPVPQEVEAADGTVIQNHEPGGRYDPEDPAPVLVQDGDVLLDAAQLGNPRMWTVLGCALEAAQHDARAMALLGGLK